MTLVLKNSAPQPTLTISHNPDGGATLYLPHGAFVLDKEEAQKLGRYLLFEDDSDPSTPPPVTTQESVEGNDAEEWPAEGVEGSQGNDPI